MPLVTRNHIKLNLAGAELIIREARKKAEAMKLKVNIAIVDDGGHLLAFARMDRRSPRQRLHGPDEGGGGSDLSYSDRAIPVRHHDSRPTP